MLELRVSLAVRLTAAIGNLDPDGDPKKFPPNVGAIAHPLPTPAGERGRSRLWAVRDALAAPRAIAKANSR